MRSHVHPSIWPPSRLHSLKIANGTPVDWKFLWSKHLTLHSSCINALAFSSNQNGARWLASGGDDLSIHLWDFHQEDIVNGQGSKITFTGPRANIFTLAFSSSNQFLFSGGTDAMIQQYDMSRLDTHSGGAARSFHGAEQFYIEEASIRSISCHPYKDELFITANESGSITLRDARASRSPSVLSYQGRIHLPCEATSLQCHPVMEHLFVTSDSRGSVRLWDARMAWGDNANGVVQTYNTKLCRKNVESHLANPEVSSVVFDRDGSKLAVTLLHHLPTIYSVSDPNPLATCSTRTCQPAEGSLLARELEEDDDEGINPRGYRNSCTMKHGSFGGFGLPMDDFYCAGSDDFRGYLWSIPKIEELREARREVSPKTWMTSNEWSGNDIAYADDLDATRYIPTEISTPVYRLTGHQSIVNTTLIHPNLPHIVTAGIEKHIILHSATPSAACADDFELTTQRTRELNDFEDLPEDDDESSERETIVFFDSILTIEGDTDPFIIRKWKPDKDSSSESSDGEDTDDNTDLLL